jgi:hypothetical protein
MALVSPPESLSAMSKPSTAQLTPASALTIGNRAFVLDAMTIIVVSAAILTAADRLEFMTVFVPVVLALRVVLYHLLPAAEKLWPAWVEGLIVIGFALIGGFNDWNSVVNHRIYDYTVPVSYPELTTIPGWMLLFWGMILRFFFTLGRWRRLDPPAEPRNGVWLWRRYDNAWLKVGLLFVLLIATRQSIYRLYDDPLLSWLPFALAIGAYAILFRPLRHEWRILTIMLIGGPIVEALYIQIGGLHYYHHGIFFGVPAWIVLWWALAALIWSDISFRFAKWVHRRPTSDESDVRQPPDKGFGS